MQFVSLLTIEIEPVMIFNSIIIFVFSEPEELLPRGRHQRELTAPREDLDHQVARHQAAGRVQWLQILHHLQVREYVYHRRL